MKLAYNALQIKWKKLKEWFQGHVNWVMEAKSNCPYQSFSAGSSNPYIKPCRRFLDNFSYILQNGQSPYSPRNVVRRPIHCTPVIIIPFVSWHPWQIFIKVTKPTLLHILKKIMTTKKINISLSNLI